MNSAEKYHRDFCNHELGGESPQCKAPARQTPENTKSIAQMADEFTGRCQDRIDHQEEVLEQNLRDELCRTICRAEEQGYRIGFDAARNADDSRIKSLEVEREQANDAMRHAAETIKRQHESIERYQHELLTLRSEIRLRGYSRLYRF